MAWKSSFRQNYRTTFSPTVPTSAALISHVVADVEAPGGEKWEYLKSGGKQWQATPKNLPRMQRTRAIPVAWLNSGLCPDQPKGWIPKIIITNHPNLHTRVTSFDRDRKYIALVSLRIHNGNNFSTCMYTLIRFIFRFIYFFISKCFRLRSSAFGLGLMSLGIIGDTGTLWPKINAVML